MVFLYLLGIVITCVVIWKASDYFEESTEWIGRNLTEGVRGASLNAIASSMPELLTGFIFLFFLHGSDGYAGTIGTTAGSAVFNSLIIPGVILLMVTIFMHIKEIKISKKVASRDGLFLLFAEIALIVVISTNKIGWKEGFILIAIYALYVVILFKNQKMKDSGEGRGIEINSYSVTGRKAWLFLALSTLVMVIACWGLVFFVEQIGILLNIHLIFVSIILAAAASSVPDLFISMRDAKKGNYDDALSNALGSNIFDICIAHGLPLFIYTIIYGPIIMTEDTTNHSIELRVWLLILTTVTIAVYIFSKKLTKKSGILMILLYVIFILFVVGRIFNIEIVNQFGELLNIFN